MKAGRLILFCAFVLEELLGGCCAVEDGSVTSEFARPINSFFLVGRFLGQLISDDLPQVEF